MVSAGTNVNDEHRGVLRRPPPRRRGRSGRRPRAALVDPSRVLSDRLGPTTLPTSPLVNSTPLSNPMIPVPPENSPGSLDAWRTSHPRFRRPRPRARPRGLRGLTVTPFRGVTMSPGLLRVDPGSRRTSHAIAIARCRRTSSREGSLRLVGLAPEPAPNGPAILPGDPRWVNRHLAYVPRRTRGDPRDWSSDRRRPRDSNPRGGCPPTRSPGVPLRPLGQASAVESSGGMTPNGRPFRGGRGVRGGDRIRTCEGRVRPLTAFEAVPFVRSGTPPGRV